MVDAARFHAGGLSYMIRVTHRRVLFEMCLNVCKHVLLEFPLIPSRDSVFIRARGP